MNRLGWPWIMVRVFPKSENQRNCLRQEKIVVTVSCLRLMRDLKLESLANGKEISAVPFRSVREKQTADLEVVYNFQTDFSGKLLFHSTFNWNFRIFIYYFFWLMVSTLCFRRVSVVATDEKDCVLAHLQLLVHLCAPGCSWELGNL